MAKSNYLSALSAEKRKDLEKRLFNRQSGCCFICNDLIDLTLHAGQLDIDHIDPLIEDGLDSENNFALTHQHCNRSKGASDLRVARRIAEFEVLQRQAHEGGKRGANLGDVLKQHEGAKYPLRIKRGQNSVTFTFSNLKDSKIREVPLYQDKLSGMDYFFITIPIEYIHHDDRINPRSIGANIRGLIEEFLMKRPQLHVGLAWWVPNADSNDGLLKMFDGQHKAAAQILLGIRELPVRVFLEPDLDVLLQANTNAGGKLRQVAFDVAVMRHLGSSLYLDRVRKYQAMRGLQEDDYSFSEQDLVRFFRGERREMERYIIDAQRDIISHSQENKLLEFIEWSGKAATRPLSYSSTEKTFFKEFLYKKALDSPIDEGVEQGTNPRYLEREQMVRLMSLFAEIFFVNKWDPEVGGRRLENHIQKGDNIDENHLCAWRIAREEVLVNILAWVRHVIENYYATTGKMIDKQRLLHETLPDTLWENIKTFLINLRKLPCWVDRNLSTTVFGPKQNFDYWNVVFKTGKTPNDIPVLTKPLDLFEMIQKGKE